MLPICPECCICCYVFKYLTRQDSLLHWSSTSPLFIFYACGNKTVCNMHPFFKRTFRTIHYSTTIDAEQVRVCLLPVTGHALMWRQPILSGKFSLLNPYKWRRNSDQLCFVFFCSDVTESLCCCRPIKVFLFAESSRFKAFTPVPLYQLQTPSQPKVLARFSALWISKMHNYQ